MWINRRDGLRSAAAAGATLNEAAGMPVSCAALYAPNRTDAWPRR
jgi:hypothetical protein